MNPVASTATAAALPDHTQLPDKDGVPVRNSLEPWQSGKLLTDPLEPVLEKLYPNRHYFIGQDVGIYWAITQPPLRGCKSPDWYLVPNVPPLLNGLLRAVLCAMARPSFSPYSFWNTSRMTTEPEERDQTPNTGKFWVYEQRIQPRYYGIYDSDPGQLEVHELVNGQFQRMTPNANGRFLIAPLGVELRCSGRANSRGWSCRGCMVGCTGADVVNARGACRPSCCAAACARH